LVVPKLYNITDWYIYCIFKGYINTLYTCIHTLYIPNNKKSEKKQREIKQKIDEIENQIHDASDKVDINDLQQKLKDLKNDKTTQKLIEFINDYIYDTFYNLFNHANFKGYIHHGDKDITEFYLTDEEQEEILLENVTSGEEALQNLLYAIINFTIYKFSKLSTPIYIHECTFNHVLTGIDNQTISSNLFKLSLKTENNSHTLTNFFNNTQNYNQNILENILKLDVKPSINENIILFKNLVENINKEFTLYKEKTNKKSIKFKLKKFKVDFNKYGIINNSQESGSCTFYPLTDYRCYNTYVS